MEELRNILENYDKPLTKGQLKKIIYNIFCIAILFAPVIPEAIGFGIYSLRNTIFILVTVITSLALVIINRKELKNIKFTIYEKLLIAYVVLIILSAIFSEFGIIECILGSNGRGEGVITLFCYVATFVIFLRGYREMMPILKVAIIPAIIVCIYSFIQANHPEGMKILFAPNTGKGIATGTMKNQNFLSSYICIFLPMSCFYYINSKSKLMLGLIITVMLFLTQLYAVTLGGYITFIVMYAIIIIYSLWFSKNKKKTLLKITILSLVLFITYMCINYESGEKYEKEISASKQEVTNLVEKQDNFGSGRLGIWKKTISVIQKNIIFGAGPDSLKQAIVENKGSKIIVDKAHSEPLQIAATTGVPSAIIYIALVGIIGIRLLLLVIKRTVKDGINSKYVIYITMLLISFASYLMQSVINISVVQVAPIYWAILGTSSAVIEENKITNAN